MRGLPVGYQPYAEVYNTLWIYQGDKVAQFVKATGIDMIVAHLLLQNNIDSTNTSCWLNPVAVLRGQETINSCFPGQNQIIPIHWHIYYEFATLTKYKSDMPPIPARIVFVINKGDNNFEVVEDAPVKNVYQTLINVDKRTDWLAGVDSINCNLTSERVGMQHNCVLMG
jgi:hypothetical protein